MQAQLRIILLLLFGLPCLVGIGALVNEAHSATQPSQTLHLSDIGLSQPRFNPHIGEQVEIKFSLSSDARVSVKVFDPDYELVKILLENQDKKSGAHRVAWDGKDLDGRLVPDEAYFFTIEAKDKTGNLAVYDPITFSGGEMYDVAQADFDKEKNQIRYKLEHPGRVLMRMGVHRGPLLRTLLSWQPRAAGLQTEAWDGKDESGRINFRDDPNFVATITYFTLPENSILTVGHDKLRYNVYKASLKTKRPIKEERGRAIISNRPISSHFAQPLTSFQNPRIQVMFPESKNGAGDRLPVVKEMATIRVDMDENEKRFIKGRKTELYLFLDNRFLIEEGDAKIPYNFNWNFSNVEDGEHIVTINLLTDNDQIGTASRRIVAKASPGAQGPKIPR